MDVVREQLLSSELSGIIAALIKDYQPLQIILFGSYAAGRVK